MGVHMHNLEARRPNVEFVFANSAAISRSMKQSLARTLPK